ncbi:MAG: glycosyltransferase family 2 protein [Hyphomicrobiaceae bacterium]|nr:glycosyltransferase family 2 protein [Hyphomicrobiaceae bacterium]
MNAPTHPEISILMVSYNTREMTLAAIQSVVRETTVPFEIIVIDNASTDGSAQAIAAHPGRVRLIARDDNIGFARANNLAAQYARADMLLLLNPDTIVKDKAIDRLLAFARTNTHAGIWGGRTLFGNGSLNPSSCWRRITVWNTFCRTAGLAALFPNSPVFNAEKMGGWRRDTVRQVDIVSGCFFLIPKKLWHRLGGFDQAFYMYGEDADLCLRAHAIGAKPMVTPDATIVHYGGASEKNRAEKNIRLLAAKIMLIHRHVPAMKRPFARGFLRLWPLVRLIALSIAARLTHSQDHAENAASWREVWKRRAEWQNGFPAPAARTNDVATNDCKPVTT